jgi:para-nitrobenzyl esterase
MSPVDQAVTSALQGAVLSMVRTGSPATGPLGNWLPYDPAERCTAVFHAGTRVVRDPETARRRAWSTVDRVRGVAPAVSW